MKTFVALLALSLFVMTTTAQHTATAGPNPHGCPKGKVC